jgi:hypothetical protein
MLQWLSFSLTLLIAGLVKILPEFWTIEPVTVLFTALCLLLAICPDMCWKKDATDVRDSKSQAVITLTRELKTRKTRLHASLATVWELVKTSEIIQAILVLGIAHILCWLTK